MKSYNQILVVSIFVLSFCLQNAFAMPATPFPVKIRQPDGTEISAYLRGDENFHYHATLDGYLLTKNANNQWIYAVLENEKIVETAFVACEIESRNAAEKAFLRTIQQNPDISVLRRKIAEKPAVQKSPQASVSTKDFPLQGTPHSLVILVNFSDKQFVVENPVQAFSNLLNQAGYSTNGGTGSARDYFLDNSFGNFAPQFDVVGPFTVDRTCAYYAGTNGWQRASEMVRQACRLANAAGIDFSQYDTDNDGYVDNVFVYYAGNNQAEGTAQTVWPHRSALYSEPVFNGVKVFDYACTSELRGTSAAASNMCGIGTFCHEFSHVLGLPDFYDTDDSEDHHTLSFWSLMDSGGYLNNGRTPPSYSSYERFFLGWLTPTILSMSSDVVLDTLTTSNKAYLISSSTSHNLDGQNPQPNEFFMLENRQKRGWDYYLPGHGMIITRINYNATKWSQNTVNNDVNSMGVDIMEADGRANSTSLAGDPFPGTYHVTAYTPTLTNGTTVDKPLTEITETNGKIYFKFMGGNPFVADFSPVARLATDVTAQTIVAEWHSVANASAYYLDLYQKKDFANLNTYIDTIDFSAALPDEYFASVNTFDSTTYIHGTMSAVINFKVDSQYIQTRSVEKLDSFSLLLYNQRLASSLSDTLVIFGTTDEQNWTEIQRVSLKRNKLDTLTLSAAALNDFVALKLLFLKKTGTLYIDDLKLHYTGGEKDYQYIEGYKNRNVGAVFAEYITQLEPDTTYFYRVQALKNAKLSKKSNEIAVKTLVFSHQGTNKEPITAFVAADANQLIVKSQIPIEKVEIFDIAGRIVEMRLFVSLQNGETVIDISHLANGVYVVKIGDFVQKIVR